MQMHKRLSKIFHLISGEMKEAKGGKCKEKVGNKNKVLSLCHRRLGNEPAKEAWLKEIGSRR